jgi:hypothetical protein
MPEFNKLPPKNARRLQNENPDDKGRYHQYWVIAAVNVLGFRSLRAVTRIESPFQRNSGEWLGGDGVLHIPANAHGV